ncbi:MAG TPA: sodium:sulfate symporter, partial [Eubacteriaceae bacterium]|nr:sodium:sulfate symporter [Eubacteriaceae bacterium]
MKMTQKIGMLLAALVLVGMNFIEPTESLGLAGIHTMGILVAVLILLITEPIPLGVTCLFSIALLVIFSAVDSFGEALAGFTNPIVFFVLVSFGISKAITKVPLSNRILKLLLKAFGKNVKLILLSIMIASAIISSVISNVATTAVFISLVIKFIHVYDDPADQSKTGKAFMIGLPVASMIGGMLT